MFSCSPSELIAHILQGLAFSGSSGISLKELWDLCSQNLGGSSIDSFHKQVIWKWLFFNPKVKDCLFLWKDNDYVTPIEDFDAFLSQQVSSQSLRIYPSAETQWKYLTGLEYSKKAKSQLGEYPFQLLCEIAKSGPKGIFASELSKVTNQDPRSMTLRLKKLEDLNVINKISMFNKAASQHSHLCIHKSFESNEVDFASLEFGDDINHSRDAEKLRYIIMQKIKAAPNGLRSLSDLQHELNLSGTRSLKTFFRRIVESLSTKGCLDKVMVRSTSTVEPEIVSDALPSTDSSVMVKSEPGSGVEFPVSTDSEPKLQDSSLVYCLRYLKDYSANPADEENIDDANDDENDEEKGDIDDDDIEIPKANKVFPFPTQIFYQISKAEGRGPTSMDICHSIAGATDYRPFIKLLEQITTFVNDNNTLKKAQNFKLLPYEGISITKSYDSEGKFKFYRYNAAQTETKDNFKTQHKSSSIKQLNKKLLVSVGKIKQDGLLANNKRISENDGRKKPNKLRKLSATEAAKEAKEDAKVTEKDIAEPMDVDTASESNSASVEPSSQSHVLSTPKREPSLPPSILSASKPVKSRGFSGNTSKPITSSMKSIKRREELVSLIKENGGVIYTSSNIIRELDRRLQSTTRTDMKTLIRDIAVLVHTGVLDSKDVHLVRTGQQISRKLLVLRDPDSRPSEERVREVEAECLKAPEIPKAQFSYHATKQVIEADVKIYTTKPTTNRRLGSLASSTRASKPSSTRKVKGGTKTSSLSGDPLSAFIDSRFKGKKKERKKTIATDGVSNGSRQRSMELDEEETGMLLKLVVISRAFRKNIEFDRLAELFPGFSAKSLKQKWVSSRKKIGGQEVMLRMIERFESTVRKGIEDEVVSLSDLQDPMDYSFFLDFWDNSESFKMDDGVKPLYYDSKENYAGYVVSETNEPLPVLANQLDGQSLRQKEILSSNYPFYENHIIKNLSSIDNKVEQIETTIRSICLTPKDDFDSSLVANILGAYGDVTVRKVVTRMMRDKEIDYNEETEKKFSLTERFDGTLVSPKIIKNLISKASQFYESSKSVLENQNAIMLSQGVNNGDMISLLNSISHYGLDAIHMDKSYKLEGYESRLVDKQVLDCDIVMKVIDEKCLEDNIKKVPVPTGRACSHVWVDVKGTILSDIWTKLIVSFVWFISCRPGISKYDLYHKFKAALSLEDMDQVLKWLEQSNALKKGSYEDYWVDNKWFTIIN